MLELLLKKESLISIGVLLLVLFVGYKGYSIGVELTQSKYLKQISEINEKSAKLIADQVEQHNKFVNNQNAAIKSLLEDNEKLEKIAKENKDEASKDPDAKRPAISKSSSMRLNRIR